MEGYGFSGEPEAAMPVPRCQAEIPARSVLPQWVAGRGQFRARLAVVPPMTMMIEKGVRRIFLRYEREIVFP
jgi:hypothetical protein